MLSRICQSIGRHFKRSVDTLFILAFCIMYSICCTRVWKCIHGETGRHVQRHGALQGHHVGLQAGEHADLQTGQSSQLLVEMHSSANFQSPPIFAVV